MHSGSSEHFRAGGEGDGARLQTGAGKGGNLPFTFKPLRLHLDNRRRERQLLLSISISPEALLGSGPQEYAPLGAALFEVLLQLSRLVK